MKIDVSVPPTVEPLSLAEARAHIGVFTSDDDAMIASLITAARQSVEAYIRRPICTQTIVLTLDKFPAVIELPRLPVQSITSINYIDDNGSTQSFTDFKADLTGDFNATIEPAYDYTFPSTRVESAAVTITMVAGYGVPTDSPDLIPFPIKQAILMLIGSMYNNRENEVVGTIVGSLPIGIKWLLNPYRLTLA